MSEREEKRGGAGCVIMGAVAFMLPPLYVLSVGPWTWLAWRYPGLIALDYVYRPLYFVAEHCEPVMDALNWYIDLFRHLPNF